MSVGYTLAWDQVSTWRLSQHHLLERAERHQFLDAVTHIGGVQAQLMSAAELALGARVDDLLPADVQNGVFLGGEAELTYAQG